MDRRAYQVIVHGVAKVGPDLVTKQQQLLLLYVCSKSLQSYLTVCDPMDCSPQTLCSWNSLGKSTRVSCHALLQGIF